MTDHQGYKVTNPSVSPENSYMDPITEKPVSVCVGPTLDNCILRCLLVGYGMGLVGVSVWFRVRGYGLFRVIRV